MCWQSARRSLSSAPFCWVRFDFSLKPTTPTRRQTAEMRRRREPPSGDLLLRTIIPMRPKTLLEMAGAAAKPVRLSEAVVVVIDAQHEYLDGALPLPGA